jgi:hypothetical protein
MAWSTRIVFTRIAVATALASLAPPTHVSAQERDRSKIPDKFKWSLGEVYPSEDAWRAAKEKVVARFPSS